MTKAIVIDDDPDIVTVFSDYLEIKDIAIVGRGYNGKDAVELYEKLRPDIVFLDVMMPQYDGIYALERIKQLNPNAKVIMVTADLSSDTYNRLQELNVSAIIYKPFDIEEVLKVIKSIIGWFLI